MIDVFHSTRWRSIITGRPMRWAASGVLCALYSVALWRLSRQVPFVTVRQALRVVDWRWLVVAIGLLLCAQALRAVRWYGLLRWQCTPRLQPCVQAVLGGQIINWLLPVRGGDVWRVWRVYRTQQHTLWWTAGSIVVEKSLDALVLGAFAGALLLTPLPDGVPAGLVRLLATALLGVLVIGAGVALRPSGWQAKLQARWPSLALGPEVQAPLRAATPMHWLAVLLLTAMLWLLGLLVNVVLAWSFGIHVGVPTHLLLLLALQLGIVLPSMPANLGVFPVICAGVLGAVGIDNALALAYGSVLFVALYGVLLVVSLVAWLPFAPSPAKQHPLTATDAPSSSDPQQPVSDRTL